MEARLENSKCHNKRKRGAKDEKEIYGFNYKDNPKFRLNSDVNNSVKIPYQENSSKETIELSLEVEIANSLKQLITSPEKYEQSPLLDVTVIRPSDLDLLRGLDINSQNFSQSEIKELIASMERQKQHKRRLIELCKKQVASSLMNPIIEIRETTGNDGSKHLLVRKNEEAALSPKRRHNRPERQQEERTGIIGTPTKATINYRLDTMRTTAKTGGVDHHDTKHPYIDSGSISILKPLVGEIRKSLKHLEAKIVEGGDPAAMKEIKNRYRKHYIAPTSSSPNISEESVNNNHGNQNTHQIYATTHTFDKLRTLLACQNDEKTERRDHHEKKEKPCLCQHCGMIGLLIDSQKGPVVPTYPLDNPDTDSDYIRTPRRDNSKSRQKMNLRTRSADDNYSLICDLSSRLESLEGRVLAHEHNVVSREYFKRVINKLLSSRVPQNILQATDLDTRQISKNNSTQYSLESIGNVSYSKHCKYEPKMKHKNVQIQQNTRRNYHVNPVLIQTDSEPPSPSNASRATSIEPNRLAEHKGMSVINEFFAKFNGDNTVESKDTAETMPKEKSNARETFWRWGEEVIKPGIDLKTKILTLLNEQFLNVKHSKSDESKTRSCQASKLENNVNKTKIYKNHITSPIHLFEDPKPFEDKELKRTGQYNMEKLNLSNSSSQALKKVLDFMSEKIYNDQVKPAVDAIKKKQQCLNSENTEEMNNIKAAVNAAYFNINNKQTPSSRQTRESEPPSNTKKCRRNFVEPSKIGNQHNDENSKPVDKPLNLARRSAIPVRVNNASPTDSTTSGKYGENHRSLIPRLKSPIKDCPQRRKPNQDTKSFPKTEKGDYLNKVRGEENLDYAQKKKKPEEMDPMRTTKNVKVTYMNPKVDIWNEESSGSVPIITSEETHKVLLTDNTNGNYNKPDSTRTSTREEKRRISQKHSITEKLAILTNIASTEMEKAQLWNKIWNQAKNHCKSKQDTVIIQVPTKRNCNRNVVGVTEVEFTIEDIQKIVNDPKLIQSIENLSQQSSNSGNMESFLLIRSRKILEDVHKRLGNKFLKNT